MISEGKYSKKVFSLFSKLVDFFSKYSPSLAKSHISSCEMKGQLEYVWEGLDLPGKKCNGRKILEGGGICNQERTGCSGEKQRMWNGYSLLA